MKKILAIFVLLIAVNSYSQELNLTPDGSLNFFSQIPKQLQPYVTVVMHEDSTYSVVFSSFTEGIKFEFDLNSAKIFNSGGYNTDGEVKASSYLINSDIIKPIINVSDTSNVTITEFSQMKKRRITLSDGSFLDVLVIGN